MNYMLTAEKVRQHNLKDDRWTMRDKTVAYNGILKLYKRDRKYGKSAAEIEIAENRMQLETLSRNVVIKKVELDQILSGSKDIIDRVLVGHKKLRLATRRKSPQMLMEAFKQDVFTCRRRLDLIHFKRSTKEETLKHLLLEKMEMQQIHDNFTKSPLELECQRITGKVQDRILLTEAAISVRETYKTLIALMRKDNKYYEHILKALEIDRIDQNQCQITLINLGQVATEELDDFKSQFCQLRKVCKMNLLKRVDDINETKKRFQTFAQIKKHSRREEEYVSGCLEIPRDEEFESLAKSILSVEWFINGLKREIGVSNYDLILPCMKKQQLISEKLKGFQDKMEGDIETMKKSVLHARLIAEQIDDYKSNEMIEDLEEKINENKLRTEKHKFKIQQLTKKVANIHKYLQSIEDICIIVQEESHKLKKKHTISEEEIDHNETYVISNYQPTGDSSIELISKKLQVLMQVTHSMPHKEYQFYKADVENKTVVEDDNILELLDHEKLDTTIRDRHEIKEEAQYIVLKNLERD